MGSILLVSLIGFSIAGCASTLGPELKPASVRQENAVVPVSPERSEKTFVVVAFSGGGTRAAAFAYGVLETLRDQTVVIDGRRRRLIDEVDVVTSVSGGSYTAAYWALFGDRLFKDFDDKFLKRDIQSHLLGLLLNPVTAAQIAMPGINRSDVAAEWLDRNLFEGKTFSNIQQRSGAPVAIINASDLNNGITFSFVPQQFGFLCQDVGSFSVARAVMASSAVPGPFAPISILNRSEDCRQRHRPWVAKALQARNIYDRNYQVARALSRYQDWAQMPAVRLIDGGITDNLGVRGSMLSPILHDGNVDEMAGAFDAARLDRVANVLVIVANSQIYENYAWSQAGSEPGLIDALRASFDGAIGIMNTETLGLARQGFEDWARRVNSRPSRAGVPPVKLRFAAVTLDNIEDATERAHFNSIPTTLSLPAATVDEVRALAGRLLGQSVEYQKFLSDIKSAQVSSMNSN